MDIHSKVYGYKTKHKEGFIQSEIDELLKEYPGIDKEKFNDALNGITCMMKDDEIIVYHCDIETALRCGVERRSISNEEFD